MVFSEQKNVQASPTLPRKFVVQPGVSKPLFGLGVIDEYQGVAIRAGLSIFAG